MKTKATVLLFFLVAAPLYTSANQRAEVTSKAEARATIESEMSAKTAAEAFRRSELEEMRSLDSKTTRSGNRDIRITRVIAPPYQPSTLATRRATGSAKYAPLKQGELARQLTNRLEHQTISLSVTVFGGEYSKIIWRTPKPGRKKREAPENFEIWTNVNLNYLRPISTFKQEPVVYHYFGFVETVSRDHEAERVEQARERGFEYQSRWRAAPVGFASASPEYVVFERADRAAPPELYEQLDALFGHYLENETALKAEAQRNEALAKARAVYMRENPAQPKNVIINHWPKTEGGTK